ncbi:hypothetical protein LINPERHAP2_LOCUS5478, partial [Linum perenne]
MDASYLLDVPLNSNGCFRMGEDVIHVNFTAKNGSAGISEHFFAELTYNHAFKSWWVNDCVVFNPDDDETSKCELVLVLKLAFAHFCRLIRGWLHKSSLNFKQIT